MREREGVGDFGAALKRLRQARGLSQNGLSNAAGLGSGSVNQFESGARGKRPRRDTVLALAQALRTSPKETALLLRAAGFGDEMKDPARPTFEQFVNSDPLLRSDQKRALTGIYSTMVREAASDPR